MVGCRVQSTERCHEVIVRKTAETKPNYSLAASAVGAAGNGMEIQSVRKADSLY